MKRQSMYMQIPNKHKRGINYLGAQKKGSTFHLVVQQQGKEEVRKAIEAEDIVNAINPLAVTR